MLEAKARAPNSCCRGNQCRLPDAAGRTARHVPGHLLNGAWSAVKFNFTSSVPTPGKINKTFIRFGDFTKVNSEPNMNFLVSLLDARPRSSAHCNIKNVSAAQRQWNKSRVLQHRCALQRRHDISFHSSCFACVFGSQPKLATTTLQQGRASPNNYCLIQPTLDGKT